MDLGNHKNKNIVFFDGVCNFCNSTVDRIWMNNPKRDIYYSSLQSPFAKKFLREQGIDATDLDTVIFYSEGKVYLRSTAILQITKHLKSGYRLLPLLMIIPSFIRDNLYKWFAKNRYKFFGKKETCRIPTAEERNYFIEN